MEGGQEINGKLLVIKDEKLMEAEVEVKKWLKKFNFKKERT